MNPIRQAPLNLSERPLNPEQTLAAAVLAQAVLDAQDATVSEPCRASATVFLLGQSEMLTFWTSVAGLETALVREQAQDCLTPRTPVVLASPYRPRRCSPRQARSHAPQREPTAVSA